MCTKMHYLQACHCYVRAKIVILVFFHHTLTPHTATLIKVVLVVERPIVCLVGFDFFLWVSGLNDHTKLVGFCCNGVSRLHFGICLASHA